MRALVHINCNSIAQVEFGRRSEILPRSIQPSKVHALSKRQEGEIKAQSRPNAALIHETIRAEGEAELERRWWAVLLSGFATGLSIGLSYLCRASFTPSLPIRTSASWLRRWAIRQASSSSFWAGNSSSPRTRWCQFFPAASPRPQNVLERAEAMAVVLVANIAGTWAVAFAFAHYHSFEPAVELLCRDR